MIIDHTFRKGHHEVCQDYVTANETRLVLSDGCGSCKHSDVGARVLAHSALKEKSHLEDYILGNARVSSSVSLSNLGLKEQDCYATLLYADYDDKKIRVAICGDGAFYVKFKHGTDILCDIDYPDNHPHYLHYDGHIRAEYVRQGHGNYEMAVSSLGEGIKDQRHIDDQKTHGGLWGLKYNSMCYNSVDIDFVALFSDGIKQIEGWDYKDVVKELTDIKNWNGKFVKRRVAACFRRHKWDNMDDFSMGVMLNDV